MPMMDGALGGTIAALERRRPELAGRITVEDLHEQRRLVAEEREGTYLELRLESFRRVLERRRRRRRRTCRAWMVDVWMAERSTAVRLHDDVEPELDAPRRRRPRAGRDHQRQLPLRAARRGGPVRVHRPRRGGGRAEARRRRRFGARSELCRGDPARWVHVGDGLDTDVAGRPGVRDEGGVDQPRRNRPAPRGTRPTPSCPRSTGLRRLVPRLLAE